MPRRSAASDRDPLDREQIVAAAVALADADGLDGVSMRRLGAALGVEAMSLYHHIRGKDELLDAMVDAVAAEAALPLAVEVDDTWLAAARARCRGAYLALLRHPWAAMLWATRTDVGPGRMALMEGLLGDLSRGGFAPGELDVAFHALQNHVLGHALQAVSFPYAEEELAELGRTYLATFPADEYPRLAEHIRYHIDTDNTGDTPSFDLALDLLLDGLARRRGA